jgi:putative membrane protein
VVSSEALAQEEANEMMYWNGEWSWGGWAMMTITMVLFWGLVLWVAILVVRSLSGGRSNIERTPRPEEILAERLARGEISAEEYEGLLRTLRGAERPL